MSPVDVASYVRQLDRELRRRFVRDTDILEEVRAHLADAVESEQQQGHPPADAQTAAITRFGSATTVAAAYAADRSRLLYRGLLVVAIACGIAIAYVDSRPTWDDTGVTAGAMMLVAGILGLLGPRRPWLWAFLVGIGIPAYAIARAPSLGSLAMLLVLLFPLVGAYAGVAVRRWFMPVAP
jgi:hypothetical protein